MAQSKSSTSAVGYERVKQILNDIQGDSIPEYQGYKAFWLSLKTFKEVSLYGQRMIAPEPESSQLSSASGQTPESGPPPEKGSCCGGGTKPATAEELANNSDHGDSAVQAVNTQPTQLPADINCWPSGGKSAGKGGGSGGPKRSDSSGIIIGLRGEAPFDGSNFPPLLWDAKRQATPQEILFIAQWIDDGCHDNSTDNAGNSTIGSVQQQQLVTRQARDRLQALACGELKHSASAKCTNIHRSDVKGLGVRKEISTLTETELKRFRDALHCMYQYNAYWQDERSFDHWARIHTNSCQHGWEQFLPWHRIYLYFFEQTLQDYDPYITLPYWSWTDYSSQNISTFNNTQLDLGVLPNAYHCWISINGMKVLENAKGVDGKRVFNDAELARLRSLQASAKTYNSGLRLLKAAEIPYTLVKNPSTGAAAWSDKVRTIYNVLREANPLWFPNRWPGMFGGPTSYPTQKNIDNILALSNWADFGGGPEYDHHFGALEQVHNGMHNFSGGGNPNYPYKNPKWEEIYMSLGITQADPQNKENPLAGWMTDNRVTAFDPLFWAHHSNVDRVWARWQELHPNSNPENTDGVLAPWSMSVKDSLSIKKLGYEYLRESVHFATSSDVALTKFTTEATNVHQNILDTFRKADIRVHRVQRGNLHNCSVRLFLNQPSADINTSTLNNPHFVGEFSTFHGTCYGGPGHCDLPLTKTRANDQRQLHHHEPRNYRIDATDCVNQLLKNGDTNLSLQMVVIGANGQAMDNALFIDGVSLNFLD